MKKNKIIILLMLCFAIALIALGLTLKIKKTGNKKSTKEKTDQKEIVKKYVCTIDTYKSDELETTFEYTFYFENNVIKDLNLNTRYFIKTDTKYNHLMENLTLEECVDSYSDNKTLLCKNDDGEKESIIGKEIDEYIAVLEEKNFDCTLKGD